MAIVIESFIPVIIIFYLDLFQVRDPGEKLTSLMFTKYIMSTYADEMGAKADRSKILNAEGHKTIAGLSWMSISSSLITFT